MVTLNIHAGKANEFFCEFCGLSTDSKPTITFAEGTVRTPILNGSIFTEIDTSYEYMYDEESEDWHKIANMEDYAKQYINDHFKAGANIILEENSDGTVTISASGEVSAEDSVARTSIASHEANTSNPHNVTKAQVGLGSVDNTSDADKPISTSTQTALDSKVDKVSGKGLSTNDYTTAEKNKLSGIEDGANKTTVDDELSTSSENPVQNKTVTEAINEKISFAQIYGQGAAIPQGSDLNDYDTVGAYYSANAATTATLVNCPFSGSGFRLESTSLSSTNKMQRLYPVSASNVTFYLRSKTTTGWTSWYRFEGTEIV